MQTLAVFGATGSIGTSTLDVAARHADRYRIFALTANSQVDALADLCAKHRPQIALIADESKKDALAGALRARGLTQIEVWAGQEALATLGVHPEVDIAVLAIVGAAGLVPTFAAAQAGKRLLLANKESVVCAGELLMQTIAKSGAELLPVDSEHNAIFQSLAGASAADRELARLILTASGGPFRRRFDLQNVTPEEACAHPNWSMGRKISVDSATLMNKGLEVIEARWLFDVPPERIDVVVHPQSMIHSMVQYADGSVIAQLGAPDMRTPIAYSLAWPERIESGSARLDFTKLAALTFEAPDYARFPQLSYAFETLKTGKGSSIVLNAANEIAVEAFLNRRIGFLDIARACREMLDADLAYAPKSIEDVFEIDAVARVKTREVIARW